AWMVAVVTEKPIVLPEAVLAAVIAAWQSPTLTPWQLGMSQITPPGAAQSAPGTAPSDGSRAVVITFWRQALAAAIAARPAEMFGAGRALGPVYEYPWACPVYAVGGPSSPTVRFISVSDSQIIRHVTCPDCPYEQRLSGTTLTWAP